MKFILREVGLHVSVSNFSGVAVFLFCFLWGILQESHRG